MGYLTLFMNFVVSSFDQNYVEMTAVQLVSHLVHFPTLRPPSFLVPLIVLLKSRKVVLVFLLTLSFT